MVEEEVEEDVESLLEEELVEELVEEELVELVVVEGTSLLLLVSEDVVVVRFSLTSGDVEDVDLLFDDDEEEDDEEDDLLRDGMIMICFLCYLFFCSALVCVWLCLVLLLTKFMWIALRLPCL